MGLRLFAAAFLLSGIACLAWLPMPRAIHVGYILWTMSFFLACFAFLHASMPEGE